MVNTRAVPPTCAYIRNRRKIGDRGVQQELIFWRRLCLVLGVSSLVQVPLAHGDLPGIAPVEHPPKPFPARTRTKCLGLLPAASHRPACGRLEWKAFPNRDEALPLLRTPYIHNHNCARFLHAYTEYACTYKDTLDDQSAGGSKLELAHTQKFRLIHVRCG